MAQTYASVARKKPSREEISQCLQMDKVNISAVDPRMKELFQMVFSNDLVGDASVKKLQLREKIINFVIHNDDGTPSRADALSCRLVNKTWFNTVSDCLLKSGEPLFEFLVGKDTDPQRGFNFMEVQAASLCLLKRVAPFQLRLTFFMSPNVEEARKLLEKCLRSGSSGGLVTLVVSVFVIDPAFLESENPVFFDSTDPLSLPVLRTLEFGIPLLTLQDNPAFINAFRHVAPTINCILSGCKKLKHLRIRGMSAMESVMPAGFESISLPATLEQLEIRQGMFPRDLEHLLVNNPISNLTRLTFCVPAGFQGNPPDSKWIYRILERHRHSLKTLLIYGGDGQKREDLTITHLTFPVMKCLATLDIHARNVEWPDGVTQLEGKLPAIKKMELKNVTPVMLLKTTESSRFEGVEHAVITMGPANMEFLTMERECLTLELTQSIHRSFPHVVKLDLCPITLPSGGAALQHIFQNMTQLQVLTLHVEDPSKRKNPLRMGSILVGLPLKMMRALESCQEKWGGIQLRPDKLLGISNLSELRQLNFYFWDFSCNHPLMWDIIFEFAFFRMANLRKLTVTGAGEFEVSPATRETWEREGREIVRRHLTHQVKFGIRPMH